ncbi:MAG TPA: hypothetical protein VLZ81_10630, partial [Blastocatellia bacterium]|nr:hypothetical protein [Blastocatellia bacterium]
MVVNISRVLICALLCSALVFPLWGCAKGPSDEESSASSSSPKASQGETAAQAGATPAIPGAKYSGPIQFTDVTAAAGINFKHNNGAFGKKYLPETVGSGCAFIDYDNDGWQDILLINSMNWPEHKSPKKSF